jgi:hypothetical protein
MSNQNNNTQQQAQQGQEEPHELEGKLFPILPYGFQPEFDMTGWVTRVGPKRDGRIKLAKDNEVGDYVAQIGCKGDFLSTYVSFPDADSYIGTSCRYAIFHVKNLSKKMALEVVVTDIHNKTLTFRSSNAQSVTRLSKDTCSLPLHLVPGWNKIVLDLQMLCKKAFKTRYLYANSVRVYSNTRIRRIFFADENYRDADLPESLRVQQDA